VENEHLAFNIEMPRPHPLQETLPEQWLAGHWDNVRRHVGHSDTTDIEASQHDTLAVQHRSICLLIRARRPEIVGADCPCADERTCDIRRDGYLRSTAIDDKRKGNRVV